MKIKGVRASSLPTLFACMKSLEYKESGVSNEYADTGSLIHKGIQAFHVLNNIDAALAVMATVHHRDFPEANGPKAAHHFRRYTETHQRWGAVKQSERSIAFTLAPCAIDPTKEEIVIEGTLDQIRTPGVGEVVVDMKTGSNPIKWMMRHYMPQLCAYQYGYFIETGIQPQAAILRTQDFLQGGNVYHPVPWTWDTVINTMENVKTLIALFRLGLQISSPGDHCEYCPAGGIENCSVNAKPVEKGRYALPLATSIEDLLSG